MSIHEQARAEAEKRWPKGRAMDATAIAHKHHRDAFIAGAEWAATRTRAVTTVTELDALPIGTVLLDRNDESWSKVDDPAHYDEDLIGRSLVWASVYWKHERTSDGLVEGSDGLAPIHPPFRVL